MRRITSIVAPIDFSNASKQSLIYAAQLARDYGAKLTPIYVVELPDAINVFPFMMENDDLLDACRRKLISFTQRAGVPADFAESGVVRKGRAHREIVAAAKQLKADLIVIATHGASALSRVLLGSVSEQVVRHAPCPVLVVRERPKL